MRATPGERSSWRARALRLVDGCAWVGLAVAFFATVHTIGDRVAAYDEGILLAGANLVRHGRLPGRDFYTNYGPATYYMLAGLWALTGVSMWAERILGVLVHVAIAMLAGHLAGRLVRHRFVPLAAAATLAALVPFGVGPYAFLWGLMALLAAAALLVRARRRGPWAWAGTGAAFGLVAAFRPDLFAYACLFALPPLGWAWLRARRRKETLSWRRLGAFVAAALLPIALTWGPLLVHGDLGQLAADYIFDQARFVMPARTLPLPRELSYTTCVAIGAATAPLWAFALFALGGGAVDRLALTAVAVVWAALFPHVIGRSDLAHAVYTVTPALIVATALLQLVAARTPPLALAMAALLAVTLVWAMWRPETRPPRFAAAETVGRGAPVPFFDAAAKRAAVAFVDGNSAPGEPLYVGCFNHRKVLMNDLDLYFLTDRVGVSRYLQFDPGMITRAEVQAEVVADFRRLRPSVAILGLHCWWPEPNRSREPGATVLDAYIRSHYDIVQKMEPYVFLKRLPGDNDERRRR